MIKIVNQDIFVQNEGCLTQLEVGTDVKVISKEKNKSLVESYKGTYWVMNQYLEEVPEEEEKYYVPRNNN